VHARALNLYVAGFVARCRAGRPPGHSEVDEPGVRGLIGHAEPRPARLLVIDDRAYDLVAALLADAHAGTVTVLNPAPWCGELIDRDPAWQEAEATTAMVRADLRNLPTGALPPPLSWRPVRRLPGDAADGVPLALAAEAALRADPRIAGPPAALASYLRGLPSSVELFAAVDPDGRVRATSGCTVTSAAAGVFFVNTDPEWCGRGIAQAMTAIALGRARRRGARHAALDATRAGVGLYTRLGFQPVARATTFTRVSRR
jgi:GNAT superfamily N-acetyltransferase